MTVKNKIISVLLAAILLTGLAGVTAASASAPVRADAKAALIMDSHTGQIVYEQNANERLPIASMVKIMTLTRCFEEMDNGRFTVDTDISVSDRAASMGGSQAFLDAGSSYKAGELLKSIVVASANDSCVAMSEYLCGSVEAFVDSMNKRAEELGMADTYFVNCTGLPAPNQYCCARDAAVMMRELIRHEKFFEYASVWMFDFVHPSGRVTGLTNTNKLIRSYGACDGGKTGFTNEALSCLTATAVKGDTRFISVIIGAPNSKTRNAEMCKLFDYAFGNYETKKIVDSTVPLDTVPVVNGKTDCIETAPREDFYYFTEKSAAQEITSECEYYSVGAPVKCGDTVGKIKIVAGGNVIGEVDIVAKADVEKVGYLDIVDDFIGNW